MSFNITVEGGSSVRLPTAGKYCDRDIVITAKGGASGDLMFTLEDGTQIALSSIDSIVIPDGYVDAITQGSDILWQSKRKYNRELLYLESTGTQWIDTGFLLTASTDIEFVGAITEDTKTGWIAGAPIWVGIHKKAGTVAITQTSSGMTYNPVEINEVFSVGLFGDKAYFNGAETNTIARKDATMTLFLFAYHHTNDAGSISSSIRMHAFKIWDNGEIVRDFIPVLDLDGVPCMYDKVSAELFYNQGTGEFLYDES